MVLASSAVLVLHACSAPDTRLFVSVQSATSYANAHGLDHPLLMPYVQKRALRLLIGIHITAQFMTGCLNCVQQSLFFKK